MPALPATTEPRFLAAVPRMRPFGQGRPQWALADPGHDYLVYAPEGGTVRLDHSATAATYSARRLDPRTGRSVGESVAVNGGGLREIRGIVPGPVVLWLTRELGEDRPAGTHP